MKKLIKFIFFFSLLIATFAALLCYHIFFYKSTNSIQKNIFVKQGYNYKTLSEDLHKNAIISNPKIFYLTARIIHLLQGKEVQLRIGQYAIRPHSSVYEIISQIQEGKILQYKFTAPEGWMTIEVINLLKKTPNLTGDIDPQYYREGALLPETYLYTYGQTRNSLLEQMTHQMQSALQENWEKRDKTIPLKSSDELLILASIIERESGFMEEMPIISGVFINRIKLGMPLQSDPTTMYEITKGKYRMTRSLTTADLRTKGLYNTYSFVGLPLTPIANPGKAALHAAAHPNKTNFLYFVATGKQGKHKFASTLSQHNANVAEYYRNLRNNNPSILTKQIKLEDPINIEKEAEEKVEIES